MLANFFTLQKKQDKDKDDEDRSKLYFKNQHSFEARKHHSARLLHHYKDRIPIIVQPSDKEEGLPFMNRCKFLVQKNMTLGDFICMIRREHLQKLKSTEALYFLSSKETLMTPQMMVGVLYHENKDDDGFLYLIYSRDTAFG